MAGIFGFFDFTKPGKGVDPDEPEKRAFFRFFEIVWRKKGRLVLVNMMYFLCILPIVIAFYLFVLEPMASMFLSIDPDSTYSLFLVTFSFLFTLPPFVLILLFAVSVLLFGPATCGMTYILRNFVRREHAWTSDFWQRAIANFKQGVILGILDVVMFFLGFYNFFLYFDPEADVSAFLGAAAIAVFLIYLCMRNTLYLMAVTVDLNFMSLIRNSVILVFAGLWRHLLTGFLYLVLFALIFMLSSIVEIVALPLIAFSLLGLVSVFINYPLVDKYLVQPHLKKDEKEDGE